MRLLCTWHSPPPPDVLLTAAWPYPLSLPDALNTHILSVLLREGSIVLLGGTIYLFFL